MNWKLIRVIDSWLGIPLIRLLKWLRRLPPDGRHSAALPGVKHILLIKFWGIGNLFMLLPTVRALRAFHTGARIDFLSLGSNRSALKTVRHFDEVFTIDTSSVRAFLSSWRRAATLLSTRSYDLIIDFEQFARFSALLTLQIGASETIGFATAGQQRHHLYTRHVAYDNGIHITRSFYSLATAAGLDLPFSPDLALESAEELQATGKARLAAIGLSAERPTVLMHISTSDNFKERRWPPENFAGLADILIKAYGMQVILTCLPEESHLARETWGRLNHPDSARDLGGQLGFSEYLAMISAVDLVVSADTSAVHLASAVDTPVVGLYGPNTPHLYGPWGKRGRALYAHFPCSPCITNFNTKLTTCRHQDGRGACMKALNIEDVLSAIRSVLNLPGPAEYQGQAKHQ